MSLAQDAHAMFHPNPNVPVIFRQTINEELTRWTRLKLLCC